MLRRENAISFLLPTDEVSLSSKITNPHFSGQAPCPSVKEPYLPQEILLPKLIRELAGLFAVDEFNAKYSEGTVRVGALAEKIEVWVLKCR